MNDVLKGRMSGTIYESGYGLVSKMIMKSKLSISAKALWAYLESYAGNTDVAFPSKFTIRKDLGIGEKKLEFMFRELKDCGLLQIEQKRSTKGEFSHNVYTLVDDLDKINLPTERQKSPHGENCGTVKIAEPQKPSIPLPSSGGDGTNNNLSNNNIPISNIDRENNNSNSSDLPTQVKINLKSLMKERAYNTWIENSEMVHMEDTLIIYTHNDFEYNAFQYRYIEDVRKCLDLIDSDIKIRIELKA